MLLHPVNKKGSISLPKNMEFLRVAQQKSKFLPTNQPIESAKHWDGDTLHMRNKGYEARSTAHRQRENQNGDVKDSTEEIS